MRSRDGRARPRLASIAGLALALTGCSSVAPSGTSPPPSVTEAPTTTVGPPQSGVGCMTGEVPFDDEGVIASFGSPTGDAAAVTGFRWTTELACERFVIDLATRNGSPAASLGATIVDLRPGSGVLRVELPPEVSASSVADAVVDGMLVTGAYVVRLLDGRLAVDLHLDAPTGMQARSFLVRSPAQIVVDLRPDAADPAVVPPANAGGLVLVTPREGVAEYPLAVNGYTRLPDPEIVVALAPGTPDRLDLDVAVVPETSVWAEMEAVASEGPTGIVELVIDATASDDQRRRMALLLDLQ